MAVRKVDTVLDQELKALLKESDQHVFYVRGYSIVHKLNENDIDTYLCHCQNKLNGNINSTFLSFSDPMEVKE